MVRAAAGDAGRAADEFLRAREATPDSCLDMLGLAPTESVANLDAAWTRFAVASSEVAELAAAGRWTELHLDIADGVFVVRPIEHELDWLEVEVGNALAYSVPLFDRATASRN